MLKICRRTYTVQAIYYKKFLVENPRNLKDVCISFIKNIRNKILHWSPVKGKYIRRNKGQLHAKQHQVTASRRHHSAKTRVVLWEVGTAAEFLLEARLHIRMW